MRRHALLAAVLSAAILVPSIAFGHSERPVPSPPRPGKVPDLNRAHAVTIDVCKTHLPSGAPECPFEHIQSAIDSLPTGNTIPTLIRIWPGFYKEEPSRLIPNGKPTTRTEPSHTSTCSRSRTRRTSSRSSGRRTSPCAEWVGARVMW